MVQEGALIVKFGQIGDVIMAIPAARALHEQGFEIHWACGRSVLPLLECYSWIHPIDVNDRAILFGKPLERIRNIFAMWRKIAFSKFHLCATLYYDKRYRILTWPVYAKHKLFLSDKSRTTTLLPGRHHADEYARVLLGTEDGYHEQSASPVRPDRLPLSSLPYKTAPRRIAIFPGGVKHLIREQATGQLPEQALRRWPIESYVTLARKLLDRGWEVVLMGGPEDDWVKPKFLGLRVMDWIGRLSLPEVISSCDACDAVISHDTGPLHLAGLSNSCLIGIFGPTDPSTRVPRRSFSMGIWGGQGFACRPCYDGHDFAPCKFNGCMHQVTPELVIQELDRLLDARTRGEITPWSVVCPEGVTSFTVDQIS